MILEHLTAARSELHRIAAHVVARARHQATGRFSLRVTAGGFGTPDLDGGGRRERVSGASLVVESDVAGAASAIARPIAGSSLRELAELAGVDLDAELSVGHDTPALGDIDRPIVLAPGAATALARALGRAAAVLDLVVTEWSGRPGRSPATLPRLWPEHFDVAVEVPAAQSRVNVGGSPGDGFCDEPYWYVGPWDALRPGGGAYWNAPFGALATFAALPDDRDALAFLLEGVERLDRPA